MKQLISILVFTVTITLSCKRNPLHVNVSGIDVDLEILRFEKDIFTANLDSLPRLIGLLEEKYEGFLPLFNRVINIGETSSEGYFNYLKAFLTDKINNEVYEETIKVFPGVEDIENNLKDAFKHYKYYFPEKQVPKVYTFVSRFNVSLVIDENILAIGLDRYLGTDCNYYSQLGLTTYARDKMHKEKIVSDCMFAWAIANWTFEGDDEGEIPRNNALNNMIYQGKLLYFVRAMMPEEKEETIMGFSPDQLNWCEMNERMMWMSLIEQKLLYDTNFLTINKLTRDGPFTSFFPRESPARAANWIGLQIVEKYMNNQPGISLEDLMVETDYQNILTLSVYNP